MSGVVDVDDDSEDDIADVVDVINDDSDGDGAELRVRSGAPPQRFHGYRRGRELGQGSSGKVFVCTRKGSACAYAAKAVDLRRMQMSSNVEREHTALCREVEILKSLPPHPNVVRLVDAFEEGDWFLLILELVGGGDLYTVLTSRDPARFLEQEATFVLRQLTDGLTFLHGRGIIHRDLKLENVLVASERRERPLVLYSVKITDFGLSKAVGSGLSVAHSMVGTHPYTAPEVLAGGCYDFSSDLWCLGVLLFVLLAGHFPFDHILAQQEELDAVCAGLGASVPARTLVVGLLQLEPQGRLNLEAIYSHEWLLPKAEGDASERPPKRLRAAAVQQIEEVADATADEAAGEAELVVVAGPEVQPQPQTPQQAYQASGVGEWLAHLYRVSRGAAVPASEPASAKESAAVIAAVGATSAQPDVMQVYSVVPLSLASTVLGKGGMQLRQVAQTVGCRLRVLAQEGLGGQLLVLLGTYNQCMILQELVQGRVKDALRTEGREGASGSELVLMVRAEAAGVVIGKQGFMLKQIRKRSGATVRLLREQIYGQRPCILTGTPQEVLRAEKHVFDLVRAVPVAKPFCQPPNMLELGNSQASPEAAGEASPT